MERGLALFEQHEPDVRFLDIASREVGVEVANALAGPVTSCRHCYDEYAVAASRRVPDSSEAGRRRIGKVASAAPGVGTPSDLGAR